ILRRIYVDRRQLHGAVVSVGQSQPRPGDAIDQTISRAPDASLRAGRPVRIRDRAGGLNRRPSLGHSSFTFAALQSSALLARSFFRNSIISFGDCGGTTTLMSRIRFTMSSVLAISTHLALSLSMIGCGVPAGAWIEYQIGSSASLTPSSVSVGTSGQSGDRV